MTLTSKLKNIKTRIDDEYELFTSFKSDFKSSLNLMVDDSKKVSSKISDFKNLDSDTLLRTKQNLLVIIKKPEK